MRSRSAKPGNTGAITGEQTDKSPFVQYIHRSNTLELAKSDAEAPIQCGTSQRNSECDCAIYHKLS